jgi:CBS domain-containing protein
MAVHHPTPTAEPPTSPIAHLTVRDAMQLGLFITPPDADLETVARVMAEKSIHCVLIAGIQRRSGSGERLAWGIVSDLDLIRALCEGEGPRVASDVAATELVTVAPADTLESAARLMVEHRTAHLVVTSPQTGRPVGMISTLDLASAVSGRSRS